MAKTDASTTDSDSIWLYSPNLALSIVFAIIYLFPTVIQAYQSLYKYRSYYFAVVLFGAVLEVAGYGIRAASCKQQLSIPLFATQSSFIVLAPLFFSAGNYLLISRLCLRVLPITVTHIYRVPVAKLTRIFVLCDILSFLVQVSGTGIASSQNWAGTTLTIGTDILIAGLSTQVATFVFFLAIVVRFDLLTRKEGGIREGAGDGWRKVLKAVYISSGLIIIRSTYRMIEFSLGIFGYPFTHEWMFFVFESVPMVPAVLVFCVWHPAEYFTSRKDADVQLESSEGSRV